MRKFRFHLLSLAHLPQNKHYSGCAFTQKNVKLSRMLMSLGHEVFFYGPEGSDIECTEFIRTHTLADIRHDYGDGADEFEIGYDWTATEFRNDFNGPPRPSTLKFRESCIREIGARKRDDDFLLCTLGSYHKPIADAFNLFLTVEPGIGYRGSCLRFRAFESSYIQNFTYGSEHPFESIDGHNYDRVIPNYFDEEDVEYSDQKGDYYLFIGRLMRRKGIVTAHLACEATGKRLLIAGQGGIIKQDGSLTSATNPDFVLPKGNWEYIGFCDIPRRKKIMAKAIATFTPTEYLEPFAGTHVESLLSGTPVITTNYGVFPETVVNDVNGYRCDTLQDFVDAVEAVNHLSPIIIRRDAEQYLSHNVRWRFQKWFEDLYNVYESAMDPSKKGWHRLR